MTEEHQVAAHDEQVEWQTVRAGAVSAFNGEQPNDGAEATIIEAFKQYPQEVIQEINIVGGLKDSGQVRSGWAILRHRVLAIEQRVARRHNASATLGPNRDKALARAQQWTRIAGLYLPTEEEVIEELFGSGGQLEPFPELQDEMIDLWQELQPKAEKVEQDAVARALAQRAKRVLAGEPVWTEPSGWRDGCLDFSKMPFPTRKVAP